MKEYKIAKGWALFIYLTAPLLMGLFAWLLTLPFQNGDYSPNASWILIPIAIAMMALIVFGVMDAYKGRLIISDNSLTAISTFSNRELKLNEIKGYTVNSQYIFVEPNVKHKKRIKISKYIGGYDDILFWLSQNFLDLDDQNTIEEEQYILNNETIGWTREDREKKLLKARQTAKAINWAAGITAAWVILYPTPYQYAALTAMVIPVIALLVYKFFDGLIRVDEKKGSAYPSVIHAFIYPSLGLLLRALLDYHILDYSNVWLATVILTFLLLFFMLIKQQEITFKKQADYITVSSLALFLFAYSFGTVVHINCYYDNEEPQYFTAQVLNKRVSSGKTTSYYLKLSAWGQQKEIDEASVGKALYNSVEVGDEVSIYFRNGKLNMPWFTITDE